LGNLLDLNVGDKVYFLNGSPKIFEVQGKLEKFIVATSKSKATYTIIDVEEEICGPHDRVFNLYDFADKKNVEELLKDLVHASKMDPHDDDDAIDICISHRNRVSIHDEKYGLDLERTFGELAKV